jgi:hypothetical protein
MVEKAIHQLSDEIPMRYSSGYLMSEHEKAGFASGKWAKGLSAHRPRL